MSDVDGRYLENLVRILRIPDRAAPDAPTGGETRVEDGEIHWICPGAPSYCTRAAGMSVHCTWNARYELRLDERPLLLDDDMLVLAAPERTICGGFRQRSAGRSLAIYYPRGAALCLLGELAPSGGAWTRHLHEHDGEISPSEHIRPQGRRIAPVLRFIAHHLEQGLRESLWFEEQTTFLLGRVLQSELRAIGELKRLPVMRSSTRRAMLRRMGYITDLIHSEYERRLTLADFAGAANLSIYHMLRTFKLLHGITPYEFLQRRRLMAGVRILCTTDLPVEEIAERVGFADRRSFYRLAVRRLGMHLKELRARGPAVVDVLDDSRSGAGARGLSLPS